MACNGRGRSGRSHYSHHQRSKWRIFLASLSCFGGGKRKTRVVPSSRSTQGSPPSNCHYTSPSASSAQTLTPSLLAPPSSPSSSFSLSSLSSSSLQEHPSFVAGPYTGDTRLFSPPVFSAELSTAPLTSPSSLSFLSQRSASLSRTSSGGWEAAYRASFGFSADELPKMGEYYDDSSSFSMSTFTDFLQPGGLKYQNQGEMGESYYLSDTELEYKRAKNWAEDGCIFLHGYC